MKLIHFIGCIVIFLACSTKPKEVIQEIYPKLTIKNGRASLEDSFAADPLSIENFKTAYSDFKLEKELIQNTYSAKQVDTIFRLSNGIDSLQVYQATSKQFLLSLNVSTTRIRLKREIFLGMSKKEFCQKFEAFDSIKVKPDNFSIWMTTSGLDFIFKSDTLSQIAWESEID